MGTPIRITAGGRKFKAELNESETAQDILAVLPLEVTGKWWGDEIYFTIPVEREPEPDARADFGVGELGYWPPGNAFCIFFGPTPVSTDGRPRMANRGNPIGWLIDDAKGLHQVKRASKIRVERIEESAPSSSGIQ